MKNIFIIIAFCFVYQFASSQTIRVLDKSDLQPISDAGLSDIAKTKVQKTNNIGRADISQFNDADTIVVSHVSYQTVKLTKKQIVDASNKIFLVDNVIKLGEVVLSANKVEELKSDLPNKIDVISAKQIAFTNPQTSGDLLQQTGNVFVQQSQMGGSSPVIRGFEANKVLLFIDGVRMNNAIYRSGHLQNVITVDPSILEKVEILYGPGSVIYGSDALGGVMHFFTKNPQLSTDDKTYIKTNVYTRFSTANQEKSGGFNINIGGKKIGSLTSFSYKDLGNLRSGHIYNPFYTNVYGNTWGKCLYYAERINGKDSMVVNPNPDIQKNTGYKQYDVLQKFMLKPNEKSFYVLNIQMSNSSDIPRYDRLTDIDIKTGKLAYAEWYYGPQTRILGSLQANFKRDKGLYDNMSIIGAYQNISEDRIQRKFNVVSKEFREETVDVYSLNIDFKKEIKEKHELRYGAEVLYDEVGSVAYAKNIVTDVKSITISSRYPDNGSTYQTTAAYLTHNWEIGKQIIFTQGLRYSNIVLNAEYTDTMMSIMKFPFNKKIKQDNSAINGSVGLVYQPGKDWRFAYNFSSGFIAPNVDDLTKVNDSKGKSQLLIVPNPDLKPAYAYNQDLTIAKVFNKTVQFEITGFYTIIKDAIVARPFLFDGQDSIIYDGKLCQVQANTNAREALIYGFQTSLLAQITTQFSILSNLTYTYGEVEEDKSHLDHIPPIYGMTSFKLEIKKFKSEFYLRYNGAKVLGEYSSSGEDNLQYATTYGCPRWYTFNLRTSYQINKFIGLQVGLENILDDHYRVFASGISAPGRNLIITLRGTI
ncbi:MAG: TonB-dependent receptor [Bacteroidales bacterium]|nr:TonB-dependent receptor [Bacteroidales bacterium]